MYKNNKYISESEEKVAITAGLSTLSFQDVQKSNATQNALITALNISPKWQFKRKSIADFKWKFLCVI